jgi:hypothetical protein
MGVENMSVFVCLDKKRKRKKEPIKSQERRREKKDITAITRPTPYQVYLCASLLIDCVCV